MSDTLFCPNHRSHLSGTEYEGMILPMLARELSVAWLYKHFAEGTAALQPKLDGVRFVYTGSSEHACGRFHSRKGKPVATLLSTLREEIQDAFGDIPADGELYRHASPGDDYAFRDIISQVRSEDSGKYEDDGMVQYHVYDLPIPGVPFEERIERAKALISKLGPDSRIRLVPTEIIDFRPLVPELAFTDRKNKALKKEEEAAQNIAAQAALNRFEADGYEGTMVRRPSSPYLFGGLSPTGKNAGHPSGSKGRSYELLKAKRFIDIEVTVVGLEQGEKGNRNEHRLGAIVCEFKNSKGETLRCKCGSGFTDDMRDSFWNNPSSIVGKEVTIKFQEYTKDGIPRFPVFVAIRDYE
jgi:ATP-dependent DNA ligase